MNDNNEKGVLFPNATIQDVLGLLNAGSDVFVDQVIKMMRYKTIALYTVVDEYRSVLELYKSFAEGNKPSEEILIEAQKRLNFAIDHAKVNNLPYEEFEALKKDIDHLKYDLI